MNSVEHLLVCIGEEGGEVGKESDKALRFGLDDRNVLNPTGPTNRERLVLELNDVLGVAQLLVEFGIIPANWMSEELQNEKKVKVLYFMDYARRVGALEDKP
jgi:hypothetical protein